MPEPTSILLLSGGIIGIMLRFAKQCFEKTKRVMDVVFSVLFLLLFSPVFGAIALGVRFSSPGPIILSQIRVGKKGGLFSMYKFRTMYVNAEDVTGPVWATQNDPRITPLGRILRKTHLDEIPQFINVLKGDMSIVGPRPERPHFVDQLQREIPDYQKRLEIAPGITGLAQICHKYDENVDDVRKKLFYDLEYLDSLQKKSWLNEIAIIMRTFVVMFAGKRFHH